MKLAIALILLVSQILVGCVLHEGHSSSVDPSQPMATSTPPATTQPPAPTLTESTPTPRAPTNGIAWDGHPIDANLIALELRDMPAGYVVTRENTTLEGDQVSRMTRGFLSRENGTAYRVAETHAAVYQTAEAALDAYETGLLELNSAGARPIRSLELAAPARGQLFEYAGPNGAFVDTGIFTTGDVVGRFAGASERARVSEVVESDILGMYGKLQVLTGQADQKPPS